MKILLFAALLVSQVFSQSILDPMTFSLTCGQYYFSGMGSNGFLGAGEQPIPRGFKSTHWGAEFKFNQLGLSVFSTYTNTKEWHPGFSATYFLHEDGSTSFLSTTWTHKWLREENWGWNSEDNYDFLNMKTRNLLNVDVGYRWEWETVAVQATIGVAKGLDSESMNVPMPTLGISFFAPVFRNNTNIEGRFR